MTIPSGFGQITHIFTGNAVPTGAAVTYGFDNNAALGADAIAQAFDTAFAGTLLVGLTNEVTLERTICKLGPDDTGPTGEFSSPITGVGVGETTTPNVAYLVRKRTALGGRKNRGRMYLPGVAESSVNENGIISNAALSDQQDRANDFFDAAVAANLPLVVLHAGAEAPTPVEQLLFDGKVATQRRRLRR